MTRLRILLSRIAALFRMGSYDRRIGEELRFHLEMEAKQNLRQGLAPHEAQYAARVKLGNLTRAKEESREARGIPFLDRLWQDLRYAVRVLTKSPGFAVVAVLSLALGIGASTTIFSVVNAALLQSLSFREPERLVVIHEINREQSGWQRNPTLGTYLEWEREAKSFEQVGLAVSGMHPALLSGEGQAEWVQLQFVSYDFFSLLGVEPALGRAFRPDDVGEEVADTVVISHGLWQRLFGGDPGVLGKTLTVTADIKPVTIVGVMPPGFWVFPWRNDTDVWIGYNPYHTRLTPASRWFMMLARLEPGVTLQEAQAEIDILAKRLEQEHPDTNTGWGARAENLAQFLNGTLESELYLLLAAVGFVLLIGCANVANLLVARLAARRKEIALRASLGAARWRIVRQLLTECALLALAGGVLGVGFAMGGIRLFTALAPEWFTGSTEVRIDGAVIAFALAASILTVLLFGLAPALRASRPDLQSALKEGVAPPPSGWHRMGRKLVVVGEIALALILLIGAGLTMSSFFRTRAVELGFNPENVLTVVTHLASPRYREIQEGDTVKVSPHTELFFDEALTRIRALPGVESAAIVSPGNRSFPFRILSQPEPPAQPPSAVLVEVSPAYFETMQIPLRSGREVGEQDRRTSAWVAVVNEVLVQRFFDGEDPIGQMIHLTFTDGSGVTIHEEQPRRIVGVVGNARHWGPYGEPSPVMYTSYHQHNQYYPGGRGVVHLAKNFMIRTSTEPLGLSKAAEEAIESVDRDIAAADVLPLEQQLSSWLKASRFYMRLWGIFAALALILAIVGVYGVMAYWVGQRRHEFGIRISLGARRAQVMKVVFGEGLRLALVGVLIGVGAALGLTRLIRHQLYDVTPTDPLTFFAVSLLITIVGILASYLPALRAANVDPMIALKRE